MSAQATAPECIAKGALFGNGPILEQMDLYSAQQRERLWHDISASSARTFPKLKLKNTTTGRRNRFL